MGWCSATDIFDGVVGEIIHDGTVPRAAKKKIIMALAAALEDQDWDCQHDSDFYEGASRASPLVMEVMRELHPNWFEDNLSTFSDIPREGPYLTKFATDDESW